MRRSSLIAATLALITFTLCRPASSTRPDPNGHIAAANGFTDRYARSRFSRWHIRAQAAGADCNVLFVETAIILEDSMVEALHYGSGAYEVYSGGVDQFTRDQSFRGVAYKDGTGRVWTYGTLSPGEASHLTMCH